MSLLLKLMDVVCVCVRRLMSGVLGDHLRMLLASTANAEFVGVARTAPP